MANSKVMYEPAAHGSAKEFNGSRTVDDVSNGESDLTEKPYDGVYRAPMSNSQVFVNTSRVRWAPGITVWVVVVFGEEGAYLPI